MGDKGVLDIDVTVEIREGPEVIIVEGGAALGWCPRFHMAEMAEMANTRER